MPIIMDKSGNNPFTDASFITRYDRIRQVFGFGGLLVPAAAGTDVLTIVGSPTKLVRLRSLQIAGQATAVSLIFASLVKRSTPNVGGTFAALALIPEDSKDAIATAVVNNYSVNPVTLGTLVGEFSRRSCFLAAGGSPSINSSIFLDFMSQRNDQGIVLRGVNESVSLNYNAQTTAGNVISVEGEFSEETLLGN